MDRTHINGTFFLITMTAFAIRLSLTKRLLILQHHVQILHYDTKPKRSLFSFSEHRSLDSIVAFVKNLKLVTLQLVSCNVIAKSHFWTAKHIKLRLFEHQPVPKPSTFLTTILMCQANDTQSQLPKERLQIGRRNDQKTVRPHSLSENRSD